MSNDIKNKLQSIIPYIERLVVLAQKNNQPQSRSYIHELETIRDLVQQSGWWYRRFTITQKIQKVIKDAGLI
jgi:hypothetical protein